MAIVVPLILGAASMGIKYLTMRKMKQPPIEKGKNEDIRIMGSDYGAYIPRIWGRVRLAPNLIYSTGIRVVRRETTQGGGGGKGGPPPQRVIEYSYFTTIQLLVCANQIESINKIWANTELIYNFTPSPNNHYVEAENGVLAGTAAVTADVFCSSGNKVTGLGGSGNTLTLDLGVGYFPTNQYEETYTLVTVYYKSAESRTLTLTPNAGSPVSVTLSPTTGNLPKTMEIHLDGHPTSIVFGHTSETVDIDRVAVYQGFTTHYPIDMPVTGIPDPYMEFPENPYQTHTYYNYLPARNMSTGTTSFSTSNTGNIRIYTGTQTQTQDSAIVTHLNTRFGSGNGAKYCSAHRGYSYVVLQDHLIPNGNLENFTVEVNQGTTNLAQIVLDLYAEKGIDAVDVSALGGKDVTGIIVNSLVSPQKILEQLETWFSFKMVEIDGVQTAVLNDGDAVVVVPREDLRSHLDGDSASEFDAQITERSEEDLSRTIYVGYLDYSIDGYNNTQQSDLFASTLATDVKNLNFPFTASETEAKAVADKLILEEHARDKEYEYYLPPKYGKYSVGDHMILELASGNHQVQVTKVQKSLGGVIRFNAVSTENIHVNNETTTLSNVSDILPDTVRTALPNTACVVIDSVPVDLAHSGLGIYVGICGQGIGNWSGGTVFHKLTDAEDWVPLYSSQTPAKIGVAQNVLGNHTSDNLDETNELTIYFHTEVELESVTDDELDARIDRNLMRVGNEWVQFKTAEVVSVPNASSFRAGWKISDLRRGKLGTMDEKANHVANENCMLYGDGVDFIVLDSNYHQQLVTLKPITAGRTVDHGFEQSIIVTGRSLRARNIPPPACSITMNAVPTNTTAQVKINNYPLTTRFRKIEWSMTSDDLSSDVTTQIVSSEELPNSLLPEIQEVVTTSESSAVVKYIAVSHSNDDIEYSPRSNILSPTFANTSGTGGSMGNTPPTFTSVTYDSVNEEIDLVFAKNGGATGNIQVEYKKASSSSWITHLTDFAHNDTSGSIVIAEEESAQTYDLRLKQIGISGTSEHKQVVVDASGSSGEPPSVLTAYASLSTACEWDVYLAWEAGTGSGNYTLERKNNSGSWNVVDSNISATTYTDFAFGINVHQTLYYRVKQNDVSGYTNEANAFISRCTDPF